MTEYEVQVTRTQSIIVTVEATTLGEAEFGAEFKADAMDEGDWDPADYESEVLREMA